MQGSATEAPRRHRMTVYDYHRMGEVGILRPDERVELVEGEIIDMPPPGSRHAGTVKQLAGILHRAVGNQAIVQVQDPVSLGEYPSRNRTSRCFARAPTSIRRGIRARTTCC